jgi:copper chaperone for superoxide dismutase
VACGIIARAAGVGENYKKICACDGTTLWDGEKIALGAGASPEDRTMAA